LTQTTHLDGKVILHGGDCREVIKTMPDASVDSIVTDPPYALVSIVKRFGGDNAAPAQGDVYNRAARGFMGKTWDTGEAAFAVEFWAEVMRVLKPGGHVVAFSGTRTYHRLACAIEDAGFEIRDQLAWVYGSGFPKSHDVSKGIDRAAGAVREVVGRSETKSGIANKAGGVRHTIGASASVVVDITAPATPAAREWQGWGTALKPAWEPIVLARKPLGTLAVDVLSNVERQLYERGFKEIKWTREPARGAGKSVRQPTSSSTEVQLMAETSAGRAAGSATPSDAARIRSGSGQHGINGQRTTQVANENSVEQPIVDCEIRSSEPMDGLAPVAESASQHSSPSTTSLGAEQRIEGPTTRKSTPKSGDLDSLPNTDCFAGIATGLTGSLAVVHISRLTDGSFVWPRDLPEYVAPASLTVAANVLAHGTGAINVDGCRVEGADNPAKWERPRGGIWTTDSAKTAALTVSDKGRWPANIVHDGSDEVLAGFPNVKTHRATVTSKPGAVYGNGAGLPSHTGTYGADESGSAARFFYSAKANAKDRAGSKHPTVKPVALMRWLVRLVTPPGGLVLDPFAGSGTTGQAAFEEGMRCVLIEREAEYQADIAARLTAAQPEPVVANDNDEPDMLSLMGVA